MHFVTMSQPICLSPLKFYDSVAKLNHNKSYAYGQVSPLIMPLNVISSFQLITSGAVTSVKLVDAKTKNVLCDLTQELRDAGLTTITVEGYKVTMLPGPSAIASILYEGLYYIVLTDSTNKTYYSEIFQFTAFVNDLLKIEYCNKEADFYLKDGVISFSQGFRFVIYLNTQIGKPEYKFEEEVTKRNGYSFIESQVSTKVYKFVAIVPEYICDAMRLIRLCSTKKISCKGEEYDAIVFNMDVNWQEQGDLASVECEFEIDNIIVNVGGYALSQDRGDFNEDYNADFNNQ